MNYHKGRSSHVKGKDDLWDFAIASRGEQGLLLETLKIRLDKAMETQCTSPLGTEWISHWVSLCMFPYSFVTLPVYFQSKSSFVFPGHPSWLSVPPLFPCRNGAVFDSWCQLSSKLRADPRGGSWWGWWGQEWSTAGFPVAELAAGLASFKTSTDVSA